MYHPEFGMAPPSLPGVSTIDSALAVPKIIHVFSERRGEGVFLHKDLLISSENGVASLCLAECDHSLGKKISSTLAVCSSHVAFPEWSLCRL
jgi:hypothetical protein